MTGGAPAGALPALSRDYCTDAGWLFESFPGATLPNLPTLILFRPHTPDPGEEWGQDCDLCGRRTVPLWTWWDAWDGMGGASGTECEACIRGDWGIGGWWVPAPGRQLEA